MPLLGMTCKADSHPKRSFYIRILSGFLVALGGLAVAQSQTNISLTSLGSGWPGYERSQALSVVVDGNRAYVGLRYWLNYGAILAFDVSNPNQPMLLGHLPIQADDVNDLCVVSNYVYAARGEGGLSIIDVSNPAQPVISGTADTAGFAEGVFVKDSYAYVADNAAGLAIIDISNPAQPLRVAQVSAPNYTKRVSAAGNYAYLAGYYAGLTIMDVSNPTNAFGAGYLSLPIGLWRVGTVGNHAFITSDSGLQVVNVANPASPAWVTNLSGIAWGMDLSGNYAYVGGDGDLEVIDISDPTRPTRLGSCGTTNSADELRVSGNHVFMASGQSGLQVINVANPAQPTWVGEFDTWGYANNVEVVGNLAFVADSENGVQILDITDPLQPVRLARYNTPGYAMRVQVIGNLAYVADGRGGLRILDVTDPAHPFEKGACATVASWDLHVVGDYAYVASSSDGMSIVDVSNPAQPVRVGGTNAVGYGSAIRVVGTHAFVADHFGALSAVDISNPAQPKLTASLPMPGNASFLEVASNYLYGAGIIVDISDPTQPVKVSQYNYSGAVDVANGYLFVANGNSLRVFDVADPTLPTLVATTNLTPWSESEAVKIVGNYAFVANGEMGMVAFLLPTNFISGAMITTQPTSRTANAGDDTTFAVNVTGQPPLAYQWYFNGSPVSGGTNWVLKLTNVQPVQAGEYNVEVGNVSGTATSQVATLTVYVPHPILTSGTNAPSFDPLGHFGLSFATEIGTNYVLEYIHDLTKSNWTVLTNVVGNGIPIRITDPLDPDSRRFYRVRRP